MKKLEEEPNKEGMNNLIFIFNPVYHTNVLYWAASFNDVPNELLSTVLQELEAYP